MERDLTRIFSENRSEFSHKCLSICDLHNRENSPILPDFTPNTPKNTRFVEMRGDGHNHLHTCNNIIASNLQAMCGDAEQNI